MALAKGVRPDPVVSNPRANAALVFVSLRSDMGSEELKAWLQTVSGKVTELTALHRGEKNASVAVGFGPSFFGAPGAPRFDIPAERVPAGFAELPVLPGDVAAARDVVFYVMATHEDALAQFLRDLSATRPAISGITIERGFQRADRRELGGFLDGLRNVRSDRRHGAIFVGRDRLPEEPWWTEDGTYLAYLKVQQNLDAWAQRSGEDHQQIMGRFKARPGSRLDQPGVSPHAEPGFAGDVPSADSHIRKAGPRGNEHQDKVEIFRRGVPYLTLREDGSPDAGLQFVSFQASLAAFDVVLNHWMLNPHFPHQDAGVDRLIREGLATILRGGVYFVPPHGGPFIGAKLFEEPPEHRPVREGTVAVRKRVVDANGTPVPHELGGFGFQVVDPETQQAVGEIFRTDSKGHAQSGPVPAGKQFLVREVDALGMQPEPLEQPFTIERRHQQPLRFINRMTTPSPYGG